jgi:perosamine synthetase
LPGIEISWFVYVIRLAGTLDREEVRQSLSQEGVSTATYFEPIHQQAGWNRFKRKPMPVAESVGPRTLALPFFTRITEGQQNAVASGLRRAVRLPIS